MEVDSSCSIQMSYQVSYLAPWFIAIATGSFATGWLWWHRQSRLPGPNAWPVIGALPDFLPNWWRLHDYMLEFFSADVRTMYLTFPFENIGIYTVDPACVEHVLKTQFVKYPKGEWNCQRVKEMFGDGIFVADGENWKEQRRVASYEFSSATLRDLSTNVFREYALKLVTILTQKAKDGEAFDMQDMCMRMTLDTTCKIGFGADLGCLHPSLPEVEFAKAFDDVNYFSFYRFADPLWKVKRFLSLGQEAKLKKCIKVVDDFSYSVIETRRKEMATNDKMVRSDLLSRFTDLSKRGDGRYTDKSLRDMILNFIIAGRDTTAITLSWFFYMMTCNPEVARNIVKELDSCIDQSTPTNIDHETTEDKYARFANLLTYETLGKLNYLQAALAETLRLFPSVPLDSKEAAVDDTLPDGTKVKKGDIVGYVPYSMGRMKFLWGEDALEFRPERWLKLGHFQQESPFKFTAFQAGPRTCLGRDSAYLQMTMTAALVLKFFTIDLVPEHVVMYRTMLVISMLHGLAVTAKPRSSDPFTNSIKD